MIFSPDNVGPVNLSRPMNASHPLNRQRVAWWMVLPGRVGGFSWYDLTGNRNTGTLTSMGNANNGWRSTTRPGGFGHVLFDGTAGYVNLGSQAAFSIASAPISVAAWINLSSIGTGSSLKVIASKGYDGSNEQWVLRVGDGGANPGRLEFFSYNGLINGVLGYTFTSSDLGKWFRVVGVYNSAAGTWSTYLNGQADATANATGPIASTAATAIGGEWISGVPARFFPGSIDDVSVWSRALTPAEVKADYDLSRRQYPGVLNRVPLWSYRRRGGIPPQLLTYRMV